MRRALVLCAVLCAVSASPTAQQKAAFSSVSYLTSKPAADLFTEWAAAHGKSYASDAERAVRFARFQHALEVIVSHNSKPNTSYTMGLTSLADADVEELRARVGFEGGNARPVRDPSELGLRAGAPPAWDWRNMGAVTPIENQGQCGSSWAFGAIAALESLWAIQSGTLVPLSVQQIMDCDTADYGCNGGFMWNAYAYVQEHGLCSAKDYPYTAVQQTCKKCAKPVIPPRWLGEVVNVTAKLQPNLEALTVNVVSTAITFSQDVLYYTGGVFDGDCSGQPSHGIATIGYGTDPKGGDYWTLKNSYGEDWGEQGYLRLSRVVNATDPQGMCDLFIYNQYPTKAN